MNKPLTSRELADIVASAHDQATPPWVRGYLLALAAEVYRLRPGHPADDGESSDDHDWLFSVGFEPHGPEDAEGLYLRADPSERGRYLYRCLKGKWSIGDGEDSIGLPRQPTRGDVRQLAAATGIELKEPAE